MPKFGKFDTPNFPKTINVFILNIGEVIRNLNIQNSKIDSIYLQDSDSSARTLSSSLATIFLPCLKAVVSTSSKRLCNSKDWADNVLSDLSAAKPCSCSVLSVIVFTSESNIYISKLCKFKVLTGMHTTWEAHFGLAQKWAFIKKSTIFAQSD